jgi:D-lactate dehydrogenase (cytochrome)
MDGFAEIVGPRHCLTEPGETAVYGGDWRGVMRATPDMVLRPDSTEQVAAIMREAASRGLAVVPAGGRTGLAGGTVPTGPSVTISMERMNRIRAVDPVDMSITVDAGCIVENVAAAAAEADRLFPLNFGAQGSAHIGGVISTNAGGIRALRYGTVRDLVLGLEVMLPDGRVLDDLRRVRKDNTGYALRHLFIGAEGTLGLVTAATLKIYPPMRVCETAFVAVETPGQALRLLGRMQVCGADLVAFELCGQRTIALTIQNGHGFREPVPLTTPWYCIVEIAAAHPSAGLRAIMEDNLAAALEAGECVDAMIAESEDTRAMLWRMRESTPDCTKQEGPAIATDTAVPVSAVPDFLDAVFTMSAQRWPEGHVMCIGHLGDGNIHISLQAPKGTPREAWVQRAGDFDDAVARLAVAAGGSFSAEHGIGQSKVKTMAALKNPVALDVMRSVKSTLDPGWRMNPGKVLPRA